VPVTGDKVEVSTPANGPATTQVEPSKVATSVPNAGDRRRLSPGGGGGRDDGPSGGDDNLAYRARLLSGAVPERWSPLACSML
jgi:hypothetical protein